MALHKINIKKIKGQWQAIRDGRNPAYRRNDHIKWKLHPDPKDKKKQVAAHFQFTFKDMVKNPDKTRKLTKDWTAVIEKPNRVLNLKIHDGACRRGMPRYYAIWIQDSDYPAGGTFAVGENGNPPPEMEIGG